MMPISDCSSKIEIGGILDPNGSAPGVLELLYPRDITLSIQIYNSEQGTSSWRRNRGMEELDGIETEGAGGRARRD
jgi:hypothetical protein